MKRYITCPNCGQKLFRAEIGSTIDIVCHGCKQPFEVVVNQESVITTSRKETKSNVKTA